MFNHFQCKPRTKFFSPNDREFSFVRMQVLRDASAKRQASARDQRSLNKLVRSRIKVKNNNFSPQHIASPLNTIMIVLN